MNVEQASDGFYIRHDTGFVHLTSEWAESFHRDQYAIHGTQNPALNKLRYHLAHDTLTKQQVEEWFGEAYGTAIKNRSDRTSLGLKAVTKHGHEDLEAVRNGAPVRPWNAANRVDPEFDKFIKGAT